jgi:hypothetical protein
VETQDKGMATQLLMAGVEEGAYEFHQPNGRVPYDWILLDNQSTLKKFSNKNLLTNIRPTKNRVMHIRCNAGVTWTNMIGDLMGYKGEVWYNPNGIANILSLADVKTFYRVTYDSKTDK